MVGALAIISLAASTAVAQADATPGLLGEYFNTADLNEPVLERIDAELDFDWGAGTPDPAIEADTFSVRWTGYITAPMTGEYTLYTDGDDGAKVYVNGTLVLDAWVDQSAGALDVSNPVSLTAGTATPIRVEYYENSGGASLVLSWSGPGRAIQPVPNTAFSTDIGLLATYYHNEDLTSIALRQVDGTVDHDWGRGSPDPSIDADTFSARWTGLVIPPSTGEYTFHTISDDGSRVKIAGATVLEDWTDHPAQRTDSSPVHLRAGVPAEIVVEYYENMGEASMELRWTGPGIQDEVIPRMHLRPADEAVWRMGNTGWVAAGHSHTCALLETGNVDCWGWNANGQADDYAGGDAVQVTAGEKHTCALLDTGNVHCWGNNDYGQVNDYAGGDAVQVTAGHFHTCALLEDGNVHCWGNNHAGRSEDYSGGDAVQVSAGNMHTCALLENGNVHCWGSNNAGRAEGYAGRDAVQVTAGDPHSCALLETGNVQCWGATGDGQAEDHTGGDAVQVTAGVLHTCAVLETGDVDCWGNNDYGQAEDYTAGNAVQVTAGESHTCALLEDGNVLCWGKNDLGQADGYTGEGAVQAAAGFWHTCAVLGNGNLDCWGSNDYGQSDDYAGGDAVQADGGLWHTCALLGNGDVHCWGSNDYGQADGYTGGDAVQTAAGERHTCAVLENGNVDCWGHNGLGQAAGYMGGDAVQTAAGVIHTCAVLGNGNLDCWGYNVYGQANDYAGGDAVQVTAGHSHTCALLETGNVQCWGHNSAGQVKDYADGNAVQVSAGFDHTCALLENGNVRCWGNNHEGQSADYAGGDAVQISAGRYHTCALLENGTVDCWGYNASGQAEDFSTSPSARVSAGESPPSIGSHAGITAEANAPTGAVVSFTVPQADASGTPVPVGCVPGSGTTFPLGTSQVTCWTRDPAGATALTRFAATVVDTTPPVIEAHADETAEATGPDGAVITYTAPGWTDAVDGSGMATCTPASGNTFALGTTAVTCTATDAAGNTADPLTFNVTVQDTTPPVIEAHADETAEATGPDGATVTYAPTWTDAVDGTGTASCSPASTTTFPLGTTTVTCTTTDTAGNTADPVTFTVTVQDTTPPAIEAHADELAEATGPDGAAVTYDAPAWTDAVDGTGTADCSPESGSTFALGDTPVTCSATDAAGNTGSTTFTITVEDTTPPVIAAHADELAEATGPDGAAVTYDAPSWTDAVDGSGTATCDATSGSTFSLGTTEVTCTATDAANNTGTSTFTITVADTTPPVIDAHPDRIYPATEPGAGVVTYDAPVARDIVDPDQVATCTPTSGSLLMLGTHTVTCTATDAAGNVAETTSFEVIVTDEIDVLLEPDNDGEVPLTATGYGANITTSVLGVLPVAGANVTANITHLIAGEPVRSTTIGLVTDPDGTARLEIPTDYTLPGNYTLELHVAWGANAGNATASYARINVEDPGLDAPLSLGVPSSDENRRGDGTEDGRNADGDDGAKKTPRQASLVAPRPERSEQDDGPMDTEPTDR